MPAWQAVRKSYDDVRLKAMKSRVADRSTNRVIGADEERHGQSGDGPATPQNRLPSEAENVKVVLRDDDLIFEDHEW